MAPGVNIAELAAEHSMYYAKAMNSPKTTPIVLHEDTLPAAARSLLHQRSSELKAFGSYRELVRNAIYLYGDEKHCCRIKSS